MDATHPRPSSSWFLIPLAEMPLQSPLCLTTAHTHTETCASHSFVLRCSPVVFCRQHARKAASGLMAQFSAKVASGCDNRSKVVQTVISKFPTKYRWSMFRFTLKSILLLCVFTRCSTSWHHCSVQLHFTGPKAITLHLYVCIYSLNTQPPNSRQEFTNGYILKVIRRWCIKYLLQIYIQNCQR